MGTEKVLRKPSAKIRHIATRFNAKGVTYRSKKTHQVRPKLKRSRFSIFSSKDIRNCEMCMKTFRHSGVDIKKPFTTEALNAIMVMCAKLVDVENTLGLEENSNKLLRALILDQLKCGSKDIYTRFRSELEETSSFRVHSSRSTENMCCVKVKFISMKLTVSKNLETKKEAVFVEKQNREKHWVMKDGESEVIHVLLKATLNVLNWYYECRSCMCDIN